MEIRRISRHGVRRRPHPHGYILFDAVVLLLAVSIGCTGVVRLVSSLLPALERTCEQTRRIVAEENALARRHLVWPEER